MFCLLAEIPVMGQQSALFTRLIGLQLVVVVVVA